jgi:hypothetical protein
MRTAPAGQDVTRWPLVRNCLFTALLRAFADLDPTVEVETALRTPSQAALDQALRRLGRSGLEVVQVRQVPTRPAAPAGGQPGSPIG